MGVVRQCREDTMEMVKRLVDTMIGEGIEK